MNGNDHNTNPEAGNTGAYGAGAYGAGTQGSEYRGEGTYRAEGTYSSASAEAGQQDAGQGYTNQQNYAGQPGSAPYDPYASNPNAGPGYAPPYGYAAPPPPHPGSPNPGLATLLGFIPGVGAMYNGQFAKGIAHIVIFAILVSLADHVNGVFGLLVTGWVFYMIFDAYQTARARRDGLTAPDPFGLNNIGERLGVPVNPTWNDFVARPSPTPNTSAEAAAQANAAATGSPYTATPVDPVTGAPTAGPVPPYAPYTPPYAAPGANPYAGPANPYAAPGTPYTYAEPAPGYAAPFGAPPYGGTYAPQVPPAPFNPVATTRSGLPIGAIWLIGLGLLALIGSLGHSFYWSGRYIGGLFLILLGAGLIAQRAFAAKDYYPTGTAAHRWYLLHQSRAGIILVVIGVLSLMNTMMIAFWHHSWPYLLILFGLLQVADRAAYNQMLAEGPIQPLHSPFAAPVSQATEAPAANGTSSTNGTTEQEVR